MLTSAAGGDSLTAGGSGISSPPGPMARKRWSLRGSWAWPFPGWSLALDSIGQGCDVLVDGKRWPSGEAWRLRRGLVVLVVSISGALWGFDLVGVLGESGDKAIAEAALPGVDPSKLLRSMSR